METNRDVCRLLGGWAHIDGVDEVPFTFVLINKDYQSAWHRDENNFNACRLSPPTCDIG